MIFSLRPYLFTFLVLLQSIAPLVHAHTHEQILSQGLHIPGLETYSHQVTQDTPTLSSSALSCHISAFCSDMDGQVVGVDAGFYREAAKKRLYKILADAHSYYLPTDELVFKPIVVSFTIKPAKHATLLHCPPAYSAHTPRAPPLA